MAAVKEQLAVALAASVKQLGDAQIPFALVGGLAMGVRADPRVTRDIDLVVPAEDDASAEARIFALQQRGFIVESVFVRDDGRLSTVRTRHRSAPDILIDVLLSNARIEQEIVDAATDEDVTADVACPVAQPWHLLAMKVYANRKKDQADLQELIQRATASMLRRAEAALDLMQRRGVAPGRNLRAELKQHVVQVRNQPGERAAPGTLAARIRRSNPR